MGVSIKLELSEVAADVLLEVLQSTTGPVELLVQDDNSVSVRLNPQHAWSDPLEGVTVERRLVW